jgi:hypothetical protein
MTVTGKELPDSPNLWVIPSFLPTIAFAKGILTAVTA